MTSLYLSERYRRVDLASANTKDLCLKQVNRFKQMGYSRNKRAQALFEKIRSLLFKETLYIYIYIYIYTYTYIKCQVNVVRGRKVITLYQNGKSMKKAGKHGSSK